MKQVACLIVGLLVSATSFAGVRDIGNGGAGVMVDGKPILLDLFEMGLSTGYIQKQLVPLDEFMSSVQMVTALSVDEQIILAQKLTEIDAISPRLALLLATALGEYSWSVIDVNLNVIPEKSPLNVETVQLANRLGSVIRIQKSYWDLMDSANRVALVLHEVAYAYAPVTLVGAGISTQDSLPVRELIGVLFMSFWDGSNRIQKRVIRDQWGPLQGFSVRDDDVVFTLEQLQVNGKSLGRTLPTLCEELLSGQHGFTGSVDVDFIRVSEQVLVESYQTAVVRQKNLRAYWYQSKPMQLKIDVDKHDIYSCADFVKSALQKDSR